MQTSHVRSATIATLEREECVLETVIEKKSNRFSKTKKKKSALQLFQSCFISFLNNTFV